MRLKALDLFCSAGGATRGLQLAGFEVTGVDIDPQPRYCGDHFIQADALSLPLQGYDFIWASPPCQRYSLLAYRNNNAHKHPNLIDRTRARLAASRILYTIENVGGARHKMRQPVMLCGTMFGLGLPEAQLWRHRLFECNFPLRVAVACIHRGSPAGVYGGGGYSRRFGVVTVTGNTGGIRKRGNLQQYNVAQRSAAMGIDWMLNRELSQAVPPIYAMFVGLQAIASVK